MNNWYILERVGTEYHGVKAFKSHIPCKKARAAMKLANPTRDLVIWSEGRYREWWLEEKMEGVWPDKFGEGTYGSG